MTVLFSIDRKFVKYKARECLDQLALSFSIYMRQVRATDWSHGELLACLSCIKFTFRPSKVITNPRYQLFRSSSDITRPNYQRLPTPEIGGWNVTGTMYLYANTLVKTKTWLPKDTSICATGMEIYDSQSQLQNFKPLRTLVRPVICNWSTS